MKKAKINYEEAMLEIIEFESLDIVTTSMPPDGPTQAPSTSDGDFGDGSWVIL